MNISAIRPLPCSSSKQNNSRTKENPAFGMQLTQGAEAALEVARGIAKESPTSWIGRNFRQLEPAIAALRGRKDNLILDITNPYNKSGLDWLGNADAIISRDDFNVNRNPASMALQVRRIAPDEYGESIIGHLSGIFTWPDGRLTDVNLIKQIVLNAATLPIPTK